MELPYYHIQSTNTGPNNNNEGSDDDNDNDNVKFESKKLAEATDHLHHQIISSYNKNTRKAAEDAQQYDTSNTTEEIIDYCTHFYISLNYDDFIDNETFRKNKIVGILDSITDLIKCLPENHSLDTLQESKQQQRRQKRQTTERCRHRGCAVDRAKAEVRNGLATVLGNTGYANFQILIHWVITTLSTFGSSSDARELLLEFLPCCLSRKVIKDNSNNNIIVEPDMDSQYHFRIVSTLCSIVCEDASSQSLLAVLNFFSTTRRCFTSTIITKQVVEFCIKSMPLVSVDDFPLLCKTMLWYLSSLDDMIDGDDSVPNDSSSVSCHKKRAMDNERSKKETEYDDTNDIVLKGLGSIREMLRKIKDMKRNSCDRSGICGERGEKWIQENDSDKNEVGKVFTVQEDIGEIVIPFLLNSMQIARGYQRILEREFGGDITISDKPISSEIDEAIKSIGKHEDTKGKTEKEVLDDWILVDGVALLILFHCFPTHRKCMEEIIYSLCRWSLFPFSLLLHTATVIQERLKETRDNNISDKRHSTYSFEVDAQDDEHFMLCGPSTSSIILPAFIDLGLYLVLIPIQHSDHGSHHKKLFRPKTRKGAASATIDKEDSDHTTTFFDQQGTHMILHQTHDYIVALYSKLHDEKLRRELISSLLQFSSPTNFMQSIILPGVTINNNESLLNFNSLHETISLRGNLRKRQRRRIVGSKSSTSFYNVKFSNKLVDLMPCRLQYLLHSPKKSDRLTYELRDIYDVAMVTLWTIRSLIHYTCEHHNNENNNKDEFRRRYKQIFVDRICEFASLLPTTTHMMGGYSTIVDDSEIKIIEKNECKTYDFCLVELLSSILVFLINDGNDHKNGILDEEHSSTMHKHSMGDKGRETGMDLLKLVHNLLYKSSTRDISKNYSSLFSHVTVTGAQEKLRSTSTQLSPPLPCRCGDKSLPICLILAKHVVQSPTLPSADRDMIVKWVLHTLEPVLESTEGGGMINISVDPVAGYYGLIFIYSLCPMLVQRKGATSSIGLLFQTIHLHKSMTKQYSLSENFKHIKSIVTRLGLVQLESKFQKEKKNRKKQIRVDVELDDVLAYETIPSCFDLNGNSIANLRDRRVVFRIASFLRSINRSERQEGIPDCHCHDNIAEWMRYVHCLISTYLKMGRLLSRQWSPHGWLLAKIELPSYSVANEDGTKNGVELQLNNTKKYCGEKEMFTIEYNTANISSFVLRIKAYLISIGFLTAVLQNAFDHYEQSRIQTTRGTTENGEHLLHLIQFQLAKIYCLRDRCAIALDVLASANQRKCSRTRDLQVILRGMGKESVNEQIMYHNHNISIIAEELRGMLYVFLCDESHAIVSILWSCVTSDRNESYQIQQPRDDLCELLNFKVSVLRHLMTIFCGINKDIDWFCEEKQGRRHSKTEQEINQNCEFLRNLVNENGMMRIIENIWTMIHWLSFLKKSRQPTPTKSTCQSSLKSALLLLTQVRKFLISAISLIQNAMEFSIILESVFGYKQTKLLHILHDNRHKNTHDATLENVCSQILDKISLCEDSAIACKLLDLLSILTVQENGAISFTQQANWVIFRSKFIEMENNNCQGIIPFDDNNYVKLPHSFVHSIVMHFKHSIGYEAPYESTTRREVMLNLLKCGAKALHEFKDYSTLCFSLLSHWGIAKGIGTELCEEIQQLILALQITVYQSGKPVNHTPNRTHMYTTPNFIIPSLDSHSYPMVFELILYQIVASLLLSQPKSLSARINVKYKKNDKLPRPTDDIPTPYRDILGFIQTFDDTLRIFSSNVHLFPEDYILVTIKACLLMVKACEYQVKNCVQWRLAQFSPKSINCRVKITDDASIHFLQPLLLGMRANCGESIKFCEKLIDIDTPLTNNFMNLPTNVKRAAGQLVTRSKKLMCTLNTIGTSHSLLPSSLECIGSNRLTTLVSNKNTETCKASKKKKLMKLHSNDVSDIQELKSSHKSLPNNYDESSEDYSFEVTGDWGCDSRNDNDCKSESSAIVNIEILT